MVVVMMVVVRMVLTDYSNCIMSYLSFDKAVNGQFSTHMKKRLGTREMWF